MIEEIITCTLMGIAWISVENILKEESKIKALEIGKSQYGSVSIVATVENTAGHQFYVTLVMCHDRSQAYPISKELKYQIELKTNVALAN